MMHFMRGVFTGLALAAVALGAALAGCEGDDGGGGGSGSFDAGGFDGNTSVTDGASGVDGSSDTGVDGGSGPPPPTPDDVYVDPVSGLDTSSGKVSAPFKTLKKALATVPAGSGVHLLDGTFTATTEGSAAVLTIPNNVLLRAENPGKPVIAGLPIVANETAGLYDIVFDLGATLTANAAAAGPILTISGVSFLNEMTMNTTLAVGGFSRASIANVTISGIVRNAVQLKDDADVTFVAGTIDGSNFGAGVFGSGIFKVENRASLVLDGTTLRNTKLPGIYISGDTVATPAKLTIRNNATVDTVGSAGNCGAGAAVIANQAAAIVVDHSTMKGAPNAALCVRDGGANVSLKVQNGSALINNASGIGVGVGSQVSADVTVTDTTLSGNTSYGIRWQAVGTFSLSGSTISGSQDGLFLSGGTTGLTFTVRNTQIKTNAAYGIEAFATNVGELVLDLGTAANPGGNTITGNVTSGLRFSVGAGIVGDAQGNTWNASMQNADAAGHYAAGTVATAPASGVNYALPGSGTLNL